MQATMGCSFPHTQSKSITPWTALDCSPKMMALVFLENKLRVESDGVVPDVAGVWVEAGLVICSTSDLLACDIMNNLWTNLFRSTYRSR